MKTMNMRSNKSKIAGVVLAGLATGAAAWYLFGTSNGRDICHKLTDSAKDLADTVKDKSSNLKDKVSDTISHLSAKAESAANTAMS